MSSSPTAAPTFINLLTNPGAEAGNTTGWSATAWSAATSLCYGLTVNSGSYAFVTSSISGSISQTISVNIGSVYTASMYVNGYYCSGNVKMLISGAIIISYGSPASPYTYKTATFTAGATSVVLTITGDVSTLGASNGGQAQTMTHNASQHLFAVQGATDEVAQVKRANQLSLNR